MRTLSTMLSLIATVLVLVGLLLVIVGGLAFLLAAFREGVLWGLACLFVPFATLAFLVIHWQKAKDSFFLQLYGVAAIFGAVLLDNTGLPWPLG
jgi:hypothetical protein